MLPRLLLTPGEPAGIGPDLAIAVAQREWPAELVAVGDPGLLAERAELLGQPLEKVVNRDAMANPQCLEWYVEFARRRAS